MGIKIEERSVYEFITDFLRNSLNAKTLTEGGVGRGFVDIIFTLDSSVFVLEIKLGRPERKLADAVAQAWKYASRLNTRNIIALVFPNLRSGQLVLFEHLDKLKEEIINQKVEGYIHTDYWEKWVENRPLKEVLEELYFRFKNKEREIDFNSVVRAMREIIQDLWNAIRQSETEKIFEEVAYKLELFTSIGEIKDKEKAIDGTSMLASYLLFNQLLFYHIYKIKTGDPRLKPLQPIKSIEELEEYFSKIQEIDYQPIYAIKLLDKIPNKPEIIELINNVIKNLIVIRAEYITHDLAGRFFHALLPKEVAKVWAAFYTHPVAAEILARLALDRWDETVIDPACGSGTLLSAVYRRKLELYEQQTGKELDEETMRKLHKKFLEEDITGVDIMPFAAHLTAINLSMQKLEEQTNIVRVARMDSLELAPRIYKRKEFEEQGILLEPFTSEVQKTLTGLNLYVKKAGAISLNGKGKGFVLKPVDLVIMNPPFSDREKLPKDYREKLSDSTEFGRILGKICGHQINLWGYFLALADLLLKPGGKIAAVIPINIARGKATEKIRNYLLENYHIKYIVKSTVDLAFSESAAFRDILLVAEKRKPKEDDVTKIVFLNKSIENFSVEDEQSKKELQNIVNKIKSLELKNGEIYSDQDIQILSISFKELKRYSNNFMRFLRGVSLRRNKIILEFLEKIENNDKLRNLRSEEMLEGFHASPEGLSQLVFIVNPINKSRTKRNVLLLLKGIKDSYIIAEMSKLRKIYKIEKHKVVPAIKTLSGIRTMDVTFSHDFLITDNFHGFEEVLRLSKWKGKFSWEEVKNKMKDKATYVAILHRISFSSPNTCIVSCFSENRFQTTHAFNVFPQKSKEESMFLCLFFNSIVGLTQLLTIMKETTGEYSEFMQSDLEEVKVFKFDALSEDEKNELKKCWNKIARVELPSILEQLEKRFWARVELDKTILKILGFSEKEIDEWLPKIYDAVVEELKTMRKIK